MVLLFFWIFTHQQVKSGILFCSIHCCFISFLYVFFRMLFYVELNNTNTNPTNENTNILHMHFCSASNNIYPLPLLISKAFLICILFCFPKCFAFKRPPFVFSTAHSFGCRFYFIHVAYIFAVLGSLRFSIIHTFLISAELKT